MSPEGIDPQEAVYGDTYKPRPRKKKSSMTDPNNTKNFTAGAPEGTKLVYLPSPGYKEHNSLADYAAACMAMGWPYKEVCRVLEGLSESSLFKEAPYDRPE